MPPPSLSLLVLKTPRPQVLCRFYAALGIVLTEEQHGGGPVHHSGQAGGVLLEIYPSGDPESVADAKTPLGFLVEELEVVVGNLVTAGGSLVRAPHQSEWGYRAVVRDPDGRAVELTEDTDEIGRPLADGASDGGHARGFRVGRHHEDEAGYR